MDLFTEQRKQALAKVEPLASRMRPRTLDEFVGQQHFLGEGKLLRRLLVSDRLTSAIFYGPPGTGKTTLAHLIAVHSQAAFEEANAAGVGVKEVREVLARSRERIEAGSQRTVFFLDEIHRFNRAQQDILLADVERGIVILVGATTENPFFAVNAPLVSRSQIFQFEPLSEAEIATLLRRSLTDMERGLGRLQVQATDEALAFLAKTSDGDARRALMALEVAALSQSEGSGFGVQGLGEMRNAEFGMRNKIETPDRSTSSKFSTPKTAIVINLDVARESIQRKALVYAREGDEHYDSASALIKSMRGSDPDAVVYWLARMLESGEDPRFVARRIAICAAEDVGNADPMALVLANAAFQTTILIGMPECQLPLAQAAIYIACAPKSNASAMAIWQAGSDVREGRTLPVPRHLRDTHYSGAKRMGHGEGYQYAHDHEGGMAAQDYLGVDKTYYQPTDRGHEKAMGEYLAKFKALREQK